MVVLTLETVTPEGSVALWRDGVVEGVLGDGATPHAARLPGALLDFLDLRGLTLDAIDRLSVVSGPGSFTGVRIGMACAQGLADTRGWLVSPVSTLDALAEGLVTAVRPHACQVLACLDGMRGEVFTALYQWDGSRLGPGSEAVVGTADTLTFDVANGPVVAVGNGAMRYADVLSQRGVSVQPAAEPIAASAARLAARDEWPRVSPAALRPAYVRRPDVELARERRAAQQ
jgi:tRNA threonylcarbamoyladenosine biosynthesis protein TsaB